MKKIIFVLVAVVLAMPAMAFQTKVKTKTVGEVTISCENDAWKIDAKVVSKGDVEEIAIEMIAAEPTTPSRFTVEVKAPQLDAQHLWHAHRDSHCVLQPDWGAKLTSALAQNVPLYSFINSNNSNRLTIATSEAKRRVDMNIGLCEDDAVLRGFFRFFVEEEAPISHYKTSILLDNRDIFWADAVREGVAWIESHNNFKVCSVPEAAFDPLYSTWYQFHQEITAADIEAECREAVKIGMKTIIVDDGWQTANNNRGYAYCGDWKVAPERISDMAAHVKRVQDMGMKYMMWYSVPYVGVYSDVWKQFDGKFLHKTEKGKVGILDPRFPEVREYLISTYEKALKEWNLDGFKLDFIDSFRVRGTDPAIAENYAGRDIKSLSEAIDVMMKEVVSRLQAIKPDILIEFRQNYIGPAIRQYGNMFRAADCPGDMQTNRIRIANLRLTSGTTAVHADMLEWNSGETAEGAARHILSALYGVVQYSAMLRDIPQSHLQMVKHWIEFSQKHRNTLLRSDFRPYHPEAGYPILEAESKSERIITSYQAGVVVEAGKADRDTYIINATGVSKVAVELAAKPKKVEYYDTYGNLVAGAKLTKGLQSVNIPLSGYIKLVY